MINICLCSRGKYISTMCEKHEKWMKKGKDLFQIQTQNFQNVTVKDDLNALVSL